MAEISVVYLQKHDEHSKRILLYVNLCKIGLAVNQQLAFTSKSNQPN